MDLYIQNPQNSKNGVSVYQPQPNELFLEWQDLNKKHILKLSEKHQLEYLDPQTSNEYYLYNINREKLQELYTEDVYVPRLFLMKAHKSNKIVTVAAWAVNYASLLPVADFYWLTRYKWKWFRKVEDTHVLPYEMFMSSIAEFVSEGKEPGSKMIKQKNLKKAEEKLMGLSLNNTPEEFGEGVSESNFVNYK